MNTTANKITIFRIVLIPVFLVLAYTGLKYWALAVYIIACLSDVADGYIARHYNQVSNFGKFVDPLADKMLVLSAMCFFIENGQMPGWAVAIVLFREFAVSGLRLIAVESLDRCRRKGVRDWATIKSSIKNDLSGYLFKTTKRNPMILPVIMEI